MKCLIRPGSIFRDCQYHPVTCLKAVPDWSGCTRLQRMRGSARNWVVTGVSLLDGSRRTCYLQHCDPRPRLITAQEAARTRQRWAESQEAAARGEWKPWVEPFARGR